MESQENGTNPVVQRLKEWNASAVAQLVEFRGETTIVVPRQHLISTAEFLAGEPSLKFSFLSDLSGVDRFPLEPRLEVNYHLLSIEKRLRLRLKVKLSSADPVVHSVTGIWPTANWHEREVYDMFGVQFEGHPDLRRILMPDGWEGHPLRKDYPTEGYR